MEIRLNPFRIPIQNIVYTTNIIVKDNGDTLPNQTYGDVSLIKSNPNYVSIEYNNVESANVHRSMDNKVMSYPFDIVEGDIGETIDCHIIIYEDDELELARDIGIELKFLNMSYLILKCFRTWTNENSLEYAIYSKCRYYIEGFKSKNTYNLKKHYIYLYTINLDQIKRFYLHFNSAMETIRVTDKYIMKRHIKT